MSLSKSADKRYSHVGRFSLGGLQGKPATGRRSTSRMSFVAPEAIVLPCDSRVDALRKHLLAGNKCRYPMYALHINEVMKMTKMVDHQTLLAQGKLIKVEEGEMRKVLFLSHQWVAFDGPDPNFQQFFVFQEAVRNLCDGLEISLTPLMQVLQYTAKIFDSQNNTEDDLKNALKDCLVWYDYTSVCQPTSPLAQSKKAETMDNLTRAVESIPYYVGKASFFMLLTPPTRHFDTGKTCDTMVYKRRGWYRYEMTAWNLLSGGQPTIAITGAKNLYKIPISSILSAPKIGNGEFTCCDRFENHTMTDASGEKIEIPCDKVTMASGLLTLVERATECYKKIGDMQMHRLMKAMWRVPLEGLLSLDDKFASQPTTWADFCKEFQLDETFPMHFSKKQLLELNCCQPLVYAVCSLNVPMVKMILAGGGKPNAAAGLPEALENLNICASVVGWTAFHFASLSCISQYSKESSAVLKLLTDAGGDPFQFNKVGFSSFGVGITCHNDYFMDWIMENYPKFDINRRQSRKNDSLAIVAATQCNLGLLKKLREKGLNYDINNRNWLGAVPANIVCLSPVDHGFISDPVECMKWFFETGIVKDINMTQDTSHAGFIMRCIIGLFKFKFKWGGGTLDVLRKMGPAKTSLANIHGSTFLHNCCTHGSSTELLEWLIANKADLQAKNCLGITPLDRAILNNNTAHIEIMQRAIREEQERGKKC